MRRIIIGLLALSLLMSACGNAEEKKIKEVNESIKTQAEIYLLENKLASMNAKEMQDYTSEIVFLRSTAEYADYEYEIEMKNKLADLFEKDDLEGVMKLYIELGGEWEDEPIKKSTSPPLVLEETNSRSIITSLYTASLYVDANFAVDEEARNGVVDAINETRMLKLEDDRLKFDELAELIKNDKKIEAKQLYDSLLKVYIPENKMELYSELGDKSDVEGINEIVDKILKD